MFIDSTVLMGQAFQQCRMGNPDADKHLANVAEILAAVRRSGVLLVLMPDEWVAQALVGLPGKWVSRLRVNGKREPLSELELSEDNAALLSLIDTSVPVLRGRAAEGDWLAVRNLGYALHPLPQLLKAPAAFDPKLFEFCFRIAATHWSDLSSEMKEALCKLIHMDQKAAVRLMRSKSFKINMFGSQPA